MKIPLPIRRQRGLATLVVLVLISVMSILLVNNSRTTHYLKRELDLLDQRQMKKFQGQPDAPKIEKAPQP
jgi:hypothetical protein